MNTLDQTLVRARGLSKEYGCGEGRVRAVDGIDVDIARGECLAIMGPSGCGKSTLLHLLGGLDRPTTGELWIAGRRIDGFSERALAHLRRDQSARFPGLPPHERADGAGERRVARAARRAGRQVMPVDGPCTFSIGWDSLIGPSTCPRHCRAVNVSAWPLLERSPTNRSCCSQTPTGNLDTAATLEVLRLFEVLHTTGLTLVIVTHDERIAATADRLISIRDGAFVDETRLIGGIRGNLADLVGTGGPE